MKIKTLPQDVAEDEEDEEGELAAKEKVKDEEVEDRTRDYSDFKYIRKQLADAYEEVEKAFDDKIDQANIIDECWDIANCTLNNNQQYNGKSQVYVPVVSDVMDARKTRFINMLFPKNGRYAEVVGMDGKVPYDLTALLDYYVKQAKLRRLIAPGLIRAGDVSGNYDLYVEWGTRSRFIVNKIKVPENTTELGIPLEGTEEYDDVEYEKITDERAQFSLLDTRNLVILPTTVDDIEDAMAADGTVAIALRYTKGKIRAMVKDGIFEKGPADQLIANMGMQDSGRRTDTGKKSVNAAGVQMDSKGNRRALIYQIWKNMKVRGKTRLMVAHVAGADLYLSCKRNPYWNDRVPVIHQPVEKDGDSVWGKSQVKKVAPIQYAANDSVNMGFDSAQYALLPIVMSDPEKNPQIGSMVLSMAAIWMTNPNDTKVVTFPALWKDAFAIVGSCKDQVMQSMGINPSLLAHRNSGKKPTQAEIAQEQQIALESTNDETTILEEVFSQALEWMYDLDYQYRTKAITIKKFGQMGLQATMDQVKPFQTRQRYMFQWYGLESFKAQQAVQQMISWGNVLRGMPPQSLNGRRVDLGPMLEYITEVICGPRIAPHVLIDQRHELSMSFEQENELIYNGFPVQVHPGDNDPEHLKGHLQEYQISPSDYLKGHILEHIKQMQAKAQAQQQQMLAAPGGAPGQPRAGGAAQPPTGAQQPPGAVPPDQMTDPGRMPRK